MLDTKHTDLGTRQTACAKHGEYTSTGRQLQIGHLRRDVWTPCLPCQAEESKALAMAQDALAAEKSGDQISELLAQSAIPKRFLIKTFETYQATTPEQTKALELCRRYANHFDRCLDSGHGLVLTGKVGTGKSHLACAILQHIMPAHVGAYTTVMDLVRLLRGSWGGKGGDEAKTLAALGDLPLLVIDEVGVQFASAGERVHLHDVLDRRYRDQKPTILITNEDDAGLIAVIGDRVYDRLTETATYIRFGWKSHRGEARKEAA